MSEHEKKAERDKLELESVLSRRKYASKQNRALRSFIKSGEIINSFDLKKLLEMLNLDDTLQALLKDRKFVVRCENPNKKPFKIQCAFDDSPLIPFCEIVQNAASKDGKKTFYVRIKTNLNKLKIDSLDTIKVQRAMADAVGNIVEKMVASPFSGYSKTSIGEFKKKQEKKRGGAEIVREKTPALTAGWNRKKKKEEGKQEKAPDTGFYEKDGKLYYIKQSAKFPADDIAEVATSHFLKLAIGEQAVMYTVVPHQTLLKEEAQSVYLASEVSLEFKTLKEQVVLSNKTLGADLLTDQNKADVYKKLKESKATKGMARVLAGCLWVREPDCQYGNILLNSSGEVKKFDNGWGLVDICGRKNARVKLFKKESPVSPLAFGTHNPFSGIPTNHLNDYPGIIRSQDFVDALEATLNNITPTVDGKIGYEKIDAEVSKIVDGIKKDYENANPNEALELFARHIGLDVNKNIEKNLLEGFIKSSLAKRLRERADSMAVLRCLLKIDLAVNDEKKTLSVAKVEALIDELQKVIADRFTQQNGYDVNLKIGEIIPRYNPPRDKLMKKLINIVNTQKTQSSHVINFCNLLSEQGKLKSIAELSNVQRIITQEIAPPSPTSTVALGVVGPEMSETSNNSNLDDLPIGPSLQDSPLSSFVDDLEIVPPLRTRTITQDSEPTILPRPLPPERLAPSRPSLTPLPVVEPLIIFSKPSDQVKPRPLAPNKAAPRRPTPITQGIEPTIAAPAAQSEQVKLKPSAPQKKAPKRPLVPVPDVVSIPVEPEPVLDIAVSLAKIGKVLQKVTEENNKLTSDDTKTQAREPEVPEWKKKLAAAKKRNLAQPQAEKPEEETELEKKFRELKEKRTKKN